MLTILLASALLAACGGGGGDDPPAANAAPTSPTDPAGLATNPPPPAPSATPPPATTPPPVATPIDTGGATLSPPAADGPAVASAKGAVTLNWTPPTMYDDGTPLKLTGYRIYWGNSADYFPHSVTLTNPGLTRYVVEQLPPATYYFVATALSDDDESPFSNVFAMQVL